MKLLKTAEKAIKKLETKETRAAQQYSTKQQPTRAKQFRSLAADMLLAIPNNTRHIDQLEISELDLEYGEKETQLTAKTAAANRLSYNYANRQLEKTVQNRIQQVKKVYPKTVYATTLKTPNHSRITAVYNKQRDAERAKKIVEQQIDHELSIKKLPTQYKVDDSQLNKVVQSQRTTNIESPDIDRSMITSQ